MQVGQKFKAQARFVAQAEHAVFDYRQLSDQFFVPAGVESAHAFLHQRVGRVQ